MLKIILFILVFINISYAQNRKYYIQLGSFKQLPVLEKTIATMPNYLRSHIIIVRSNSWFIPFAYHTPNRSALRTKLASYKRYFPDAYINDSSYILKHQVVRNYISRPKPRPKRRVYRREPVVHHYQPRPVVRDSQNVAISEEDNSLGYTYPLIKERRERVQESRSTQIPAPTTKEVTTEDKKYKHFNKMMLSGNHYYLAYKSATKGSDLLVKVSFQNHKVTYQPLLGNMNMREARYLIDDNKLYMFADTFSKQGAFSKIDGYKDDYILVSSWSNGKKLNTLRYYYHVDDARSYLSMSRSRDDLTKILEEGSDFDWDFED